jgi:hypothetical protein
MESNTSLLIEPIRPDELYPRPLFLQKLAITEATLRSARRRGLRTYRVHGRSYVLGKDWIDYVIGQVGSSAQSSRISDPTQADSPARMKG